jgi:hypothetical protein
MSSSEKPLTSVRGCLPFFILILQSHATPVASRAGSGLKGAREAGVPSKTLMMPRTARHPGQRDEAPLRLYQESLG